MAVDRVARGAGDLADLASMGVPAGPAAAGAIVMVSLDLAALHYPALLQAARAAVTAITKLPGYPAQAPPG